jgi:tetratricopeptide (TPR) repeat protein
MSEFKLRDIAIIVLFVAFALVVAYLLPGCKSQGGDAGGFRAAFVEAAPRPVWWDRVDAKTVRTYDELLAYWQDKARTPNEFFKSAYQAVLDYPEDTDLVMLAINLMPYGDTAYPHTVTMLEFALEYYFDYDRPLANYGGRSGDTVAGMVKMLARVYNRAGDYGHAVEVCERLLDLRGGEVNDQMLELITLEYAEALHNYGRGAEAIASLETAIDAYHGDWEKKLRERLDEYRAAR